MARVLRNQSFACRRCDERSRGCLQAQQDAGAAAAWFPGLTTMADLQANWDFLSDFKQRGALALYALRARRLRVLGAWPAMATFWTSRVCARWRRCIFQTKAAPKW